MDGMESDEVKWESLGGTEPPLDGEPGGPPRVPQPGRPEPDIEPSRPGQRKRGRALLGAMVAALVLLSGVLGWGLARSRDAADRIAVVGPSLTAAPPASTPSAEGTSGGFDPETIGAQVEGAVVNVNTTFDENPFDSTPGSGSAAGTGMIVTSSGQVLTNNHVIEGATSILVTISGYGTRRATVVGADPSDDVALLQVSGVSGLPTVELADSSNLTVDQPVVAMGNALGQGGAPTVTEGTITGLERSITVGDGRGGTSDLSGLIQTDARIQPGDSGGPLVNADGQVVGMITAGSRTTRFTQGSSVGYAIPSEDALVVVNQIRAGRASSTIFIGARGYLGVGVQDLDATTASELGLEVGAGVLVTGISPGMPADRAGLTQDSVITAINGQHVSSSDELGAAIRSHRPGERIRVTWIDSNRRIHTATVQLATGPAI